MVEDLDHAEFSQHFTLDGVTVYVKTDFIFRDRDGALCIVDWKTSRGTGAEENTSGDERNAAVQLGVYGYYAVTVLGEPVDGIRLYEVNLLRGGAVTEHTIREEMIDSFRAHIADGIARLSSVLVEGDRERNEAKAVHHFPKIDNGRCHSCNFFRICKDEKSAFRIP